MGIFSFLKSEPYTHAQVGSFKRAGNKWSGQIILQSQDQAELLLAGDRNGPNTNAVELASELKSKFESLRPIIASSLYEHYLPYREALDSENLGDTSEPFPKINHPDEAWKYVRLERVVIEPQAGIMTVEFDYSTTWDEEHTVGARFHNWQFAELCGSV